MDTLLLSMASGDCFSVEGNPVSRKMCIPGLTPPYDDSENDSTQDHLPVEHSLFEEIEKIHSQQTDEENNAETSILASDLLEQSNDLSTIDVRQLRGRTVTSKRTECVKSPTPKKKQACMNPTAVMARETRARKKKYIAKLVSDIDHLKSENQSLKQENCSLKNNVKTLSEEVQYFKSILENESNLSKIIKGITNIPEMNVVPKIRCCSTTDERVSNSETLKRSSESQISGEPESKQAKMETGICLHVRKGSISLEMCAKCNNSR